MKKISNSHIQVMTCGAACSYVDGSLHATTSLDKLVAVVKTAFAKKH